MAMIDSAVRPISQWSSTFLSQRPLGMSAVFAALGTAAATLISRTEALDTSSIFSGVFDLLTIFTGFLATFYVFVASRQNRFLSKIQHTQTFKQMVGLLRFTIWWSGAMILASYALMILDPKQIQNWSVTQFVILLWFYNLSLIGVNFVRCARQFNTVLTAGE
jgi:uncharacterized membrane protein